MINMPCQTCWHHRLSRSHTDNNQLQVNPDYMVLDNCNKCQKPHYPTEKICRNDHRFCRTCSPSTSKCNTCPRMQLRNFRDITATFVNSGIRYSCWYKDLGCKVQKGSEVDIKTHETECEFGQRQCSTQGCVSVSLTKNNLFNHLMSHRGQLSIHPNVKILVEIYFMHRETYDLFAFAVVRDNNQNCLRFAVYSISNRESQKNKYKFELRLYPLMDSQMPVKIKQDYTNDLSDFSLSKNLTLANSESRHYFYPIGRAKNRQYRFFARIGMPRFEDAKDEEEAVESETDEIKLNILVVAELN